MIFSRLGMAQPDLAALGTAGQDNARFMILLGRARRDATRRDLTGHGKTRQRKERIFAGQDTVWLGRTEPSVTGQN